MEGAVRSDEPTITDAIHAWELAKTLQDNPELLRWIVEKSQTRGGLVKIKTLVCAHLNRQI